MSHPDSRDRSRDRSGSRSRSRASSPRSPIEKLAKDIDMGEDIDFVVGVTAAALTADQLFKLAQGKKHNLSHLAKAGLGAAVTVGAYKMYQRERDEKHHRQGEKSRGRGRSLHSADRGAFDERHNHGRRHPENWATIKSPRPDLEPFDTRRRPELVDRRGRWESEEIWRMPRRRDSAERYPASSPRSRSISLAPRRRRHSEGQSTLNRFLNPVS